MLLEGDTCGVRSESTEGCRGSQGQRSSHAIVSTNTVLTKNLLNELAQKCLSIQSHKYLIT